MCCLHHLEDDLAVGDVDSGTAQLLVECGVVQQVEVLQQQQSGALEVRIQREHRAQLVE